MKFSIKIAAVMILLMALPLIAVTICHQNTTVNHSSDFGRSNNELIAQTEADFMDNMFDRVITDVKVYAADDRIKRYAELGAGGYSPELKKTEEYDLVVDYMNKICRSDNIIRMELVNSKNEVVAGSDGAKTGSENTLFDDNSDDNNGISSMFMFGNGNGIPAFTVKRNVYSQQNKKVGTLYAVYSVDSIRSAVESVHTGDYTKLVIIDSAQKVIESPFAAVREYTWYDEYSQIGSVVTAACTDNSKGVSESVDYTFDNHPKTVCTSYVSNSGWAVMGITDLYELSEDDNTLLIVGIIMGCISLGLIIFLTIVFTKPIGVIDDYLDKKLKGDTYCQLPEETGDEFGLIGHKFNKIFDELSSSELRYRTIAEMSDSVVFEINFKTNQVHVSNNFNQKFSFRPKDETLRESFLYKWHIHKDDKLKYSSDIEALFNKNNDRWQGEYRFKNIHGNFSWVLIKAKKLRDRMDKSYRIVGVISDIDREKESELHLIRKASFDALTQLYNRETFLKKLQEQMELSAKKNTLDAVLFVDLDDFKHFNDEYGHSCGDEVLKFTADTIKELTFERGFGGRFGGDEFIMCLTGMKLIGDTGKIAQEMIDILGKGFISESTGSEVCIHCSIGIAFFRENGNDTEEVIASADAAMYKIKKHGKSNFAYAAADEHTDGTKVIGKPIDSNRHYEGEDLLDNPILSADKYEFKLSEEKDLPKLPKRFK